MFTENYIYVVKSFIFKTKTTTDIQLTRKTPYRLFVMLKASAIRYASRTLTHEWSFALVPCAQVIDYQRTVPIRTAINFHALTERPITMRSHKHNEI